jgi:transcription termination factor NusB
MCLVQLATQREEMGRWEISEFCEDDEIWGWGEFDHEVLDKLCMLVDQKWVEISRDVQSVISSRWAWHRMCPVLRAVVRCAATELSDGIDIRIVVKEYSNIACAFYSKESGEVSFVRGAINAYHKQRLSFAAQTNDSKVTQSDSDSNL